MVVFQLVLWIQFFSLLKKEDQHIFVLFLLSGLSAGFTFGDWHVNCHSKTIRNRGTPTDTWQVANEKRLQSTRRESGSGPHSTQKLFRPLHNMRISLLICFSCVFCASSMPVHQGLLWVIWFFWEKLAISPDSDVPFVCWAVRAGSEWNHWWKRIHQLFQENLYSSEFQQKGKFWGWN